MAEDLVRVAAVDGAVAEVDGLSGRRYKATGGGMYEMTPRDAWAFRQIGAFTPNVGPGLAAPGGYTCSRGHRNYFKTCGRCEELEAREGFNDLVEALGLPLATHLMLMGAYNPIMAELADEATRAAKDLAQQGCPAARIGIAMDPADGHILAYDTAEGLMGDGWEVIYDATARTQAGE